MRHLNPRPYWSHARLLGGCSLLCVTLGMSHAASGLERRGSRPADSFYERFHVSLEGGWLINESSDNLSFSGNLSAAGSVAPGRNGHSLGVEAGGAFNPLYDWRARWRSNILRTATGSGFSSAGTITDTVSVANALRFHTFDGEIGYRPPGTPLRLFAGARVLKSSNTLAYNYSHQEKFSTVTGDGTHDVALSGIGPRAGFELTVPFPEKPVFASLSGSVAAIFAKRDHTFTGTEGADVVRNFGRHVTIFNAEATATVGYRFTSSAQFELGYRVQHFSNMLPAITQVNVGNVSGTVSGSGNVLVSGPIAKLTIAWP